MSYDKARRCWLGQVSKAGVRRRKRCASYAEAAAWVARQRAEMDAPANETLSETRREPTAEELAAMRRPRVPTKRTPGTGAVHLLKSKGLYQAALTRNGHYAYLGLFPTRELAEAAVAAALAGG